ncbi:tumor necrosis factor receptor superfamily member 5 isoform 2-T2 [Porphyrio hochstetteri]
MKWIGVLGLFGAVLLGCWELGDALRCLEKQYEHKGKCCNRCQPGEKLVSECSGEENTVCTSCEGGHYQQSWTRERHCAPHDICEANAGLVVKTPGNATHNTVCQCQLGMHCSDSSCQTCVENQPCQLGYGFVADKTLVQVSPHCEPCKEGTFSNVSSKTEPCYPWTSCEEKGLVVKAKGTSTSDVICESSKRSSLSVLIPITAAVVTCLVGILIYCLVHTNRDPGAPPARGGGRSLTCAGDPSQGPACGPGGWQGEPHCRAGEAVRVQALPPTGAWTGASGVSSLPSPAWEEVKHLAWLLTV